MMKDEWLEGLKSKVTGQGKRKSPEPVGFGTLDFIPFVSSRGRFTGRACSGGSLSGCGGLEGLLHGRDYTGHG